MNINKLFPIQKELDRRIVERFSELNNEDLLPRKILALQVETSELCQEWRGFKFWSKKQDAKTSVMCMDCSGCGYKHSKEYICPKCVGTGSSSNPLLEEYVDGLHFILSIGIELGIESHKPFPTSGEPLELFIDQYQIVANLSMETSQDYREINYRDVIDNFLGLGESLGFTWGQIEDAYMAKNEINIIRQESGY